MAKRFSPLTVKVSIDFSIFLCSTEQFFHYSLMVNEVFLLVLYFSLKLKGHYTFFSKKLWCQVKGLKIICFLALPREWNILRQEIMTLPWNTSSMHCKLMVKMLRQWWHKELCESITVFLLMLIPFSVSMGHSSICFGLYYLFVFASVHCMLSCMLHLFSLSLQRSKLCISHTCYPVLIPIICHLWHYPDLVSWCKWQ